MNWLALIFVVNFLVLGGLLIWSQSQTRRALRLLEVCLDQESFTGGGDSKTP